MNVKIWIDNPITALFRELDKRKHKKFQGGYEPIPDIVLFSPEIEGDFRRRNRKNTLRHILMAIEVKASERDQSRLAPGEIIEDILKLEAFRKEARRRRSNFVPTMIVIDTAPDKKEQMTEDSLQFILEEAREHNVGLFYLSPDRQEIVEWDLSALSI